MQPIREVAEQPLTWAQARGTRSLDELRAGEALAATLHHRRGGRVSAAAADGRWDFRRAGFWRPSVGVHVPGSDQPLGTFVARWTGTGTLHLAGDRAFHWTVAHGWHSRWKWLAADGTPLLQIRVHQGLIHATGEVEVLPAARDLVDLSLLVTLGWYLARLQGQDGAVGAVVATMG